MRLFPKRGAEVQSTTLFFETFFNDSRIAASKVLGEAQTWSLV